MSTAQLLWTRIFPVALVLALASNSRAQTTWYVDVNATAPGSGTLADPYASISFAVMAPTTVNDDIIVVGPGTYLEHVRIENKRLRVRSSDGPLVTIIQASAPGNVVFLDDAAAVLEGFTVTGHTSSGPAATAGVFMYDGAIRGCVLRGNARGVFVNLEGTIADTSIAGNSTGVTTNNFGTWLDISNSIVAGNTLDFGGTNVGSISIEYSAGFVQAIFGDATVLGPGVIIGDPMLWDVMHDDVRLKPGSVCIDAGDPTSPLDPDGSRRDVGALPFDANYAPAPTVYCTAKVNSLGCTPAIAASGTASASSASPFAINCVNQINQRMGFLTYGFQPLATAYQGGWKCLRAPTIRTSPQNSGGSIGIDDCSGTFSYDFSARIQSGLDSSLQPGVIVYAQYWSRDSAASFGNNRSDAIRFGIAP